MPNYIEYNEGDEPKHEELKSDGSYAEPIENQERLNAEEPIALDEEAQTEKIFVRNTGGFKPPKTIVFIVAVVGLIAVFVLSKFWTRESELSRFIVQGNRISKTEEIERALSAFIGKKMNDVSLSDIVDTLQSLPYIRKVIATKELPDAVRLRVQERRPIAIATVGKTLRLIDEAGFVMSKSESVLESTRLPLLTGFTKIVRDSLSSISKLDSAESANALGFCSALMETKYAKMLVSEVHIAPNNQLHILTADSETTFIFGNGDYEERLNNFEIFWKQVVIKKGLKPFEYVDVRFDGKIFAKEHETINPKRKSQN
ncbi:MAG: FtsQ-type POTRA domain-containing protein [Chloroherpetonaceae bacterium]